MKPNIGRLKQNISTFRLVIGILLKNDDLEVVGQSSKNFLLFLVELYVKFQATKVNVATAEIGIYALNKLNIRRDFKNKQIGAWCCEIL